MHSQISFESLAALMNFFQPAKGCGSAAIIAPKIDQALLTFEHCGGGDARLANPIRGHVCPVSASGQADLESAGRVTVLLGPDQRQPLQSSMSGGFAVAMTYDFVHSANSRAQ